MADHPHHHPNPPDTRKLWDDGSYKSVAHETARMWFWVTILGAIAFMGVVFVWIML